MARKPRSGRGATRTPVTIDLEAKKVEKAKPAESADGSAPSTGAVSGNIPKPEPVAMSSIERNTAALGQSSTDGEAKVDAKPSPAPTGTPKPEASKTTEPKPATAPSASQRPAPPPNRKSGGLGAVGAGLIGGLVALLGGAGLQWAGVLPSFGGSDQRVEAPAVDLAPLEARITVLQTELEQVSANAGSADAQQAATAANEQAAAIQTNVDNLQAQLEELRTAMTSGGNDGGGNDGGQEVTALGETVNGLGQTVTGLQASVEAVQSDVGNFKSTVETSLADLQTKVDANAQTLANSDSGETVARAVAAAGLKTAIDRGSPFMAELETFASVGGSDETVATLRDHAASGVPTVTQLVEQFQPVARQIVATGEGVSADASIADRLMSSARSLVQVRPVGEVEGDKPGAIAARIEERLKSGNLSAAVAEWEMLPDAAKQATADFADRMRARNTVDGLVETLLNRAMVETTDSATPAADDAPAQSQ